MKLLAIFLLALTGFFEIASSVAITGVTDDIAGSAVGGDCHNGDEKCSILPIILLGRHSIKRCINHNWVDHEICNAGVSCIADPSPHCALATINGEIADKDETPVVAANEISSRQQVCLEGTLQCAYLDPIKRHIIQRCYGRNWVNTKVCEATETCIGGAAPQCVAQTVLSRDEDADEDTDEQDTNADDIDADLAHKSDLPCTKCKRMRDDCFRVGPTHLLPHRPLLLALTNLAVEP
ncbi:uncharacterized protein J4E84_010612 [Alternaria hordeiaustralica]|uniref:uncharacterized protein n=1 Tax=Alternaria hordeiaustralica TaxID=1187925 RepID=UPI0020C1DD60|nr:uncharacterized protein J4E84_010612 [Alternaria hordeiaustralica]KAI4674374.1 hypothetical protein J4E84_010612 [Alternaria hordeiaustralica]